MRNDRDGHEGEAVRGPASGADAQDSTPRKRTLKARWRTGPRTRAWDEMWRWLLADLPGTPETGGADAPRDDTPDAQSGGEGAGGH